MADTFNDLITRFEKKDLQWLSDNLPHRRMHSGKMCPISRRGEAIATVYRRKIAAHRGAERAANPEAQEARAAAAQEQAHIERILRAFAADPTLRPRIKGLPRAEQGAALAQAFETLGV